MDCIFLIRLVSFSSGVDTGAGFTSFLTVRALFGQKN